MAALIEFLEKIPNLMVDGHSHLLDRFSLETWSEMLQQHSSPFQTCTRSITRVLLIRPEERGRHTADPLKHWLRYLMCCSFVMATVQLLGIADHTATD